MEKRLKAIRARGGKLVVVDPRRSETAAIADQHLFVRPGQDAALLFGLLNTLFEEGLTRASELPLDGIEEVCTAIAAFSAEAMSARCGVPPSRSASWRGLRGGGQGGLLRTHGRFDPGLRHALPVAGAADQLWSPATSTGSAARCAPSRRWIWWRPPRAAILTPGVVGCRNCPNTAANCR